MINVWDLWEKEWENAYRFFNSKGNIKTKARHKERWFKEFIDMLESIKLETIKNMRSFNK